jgi:hypothetical protein
MDAKWMTYWKIEKKVLMTQAVFTFEKSTEPSIPRYHSTPQMELCTPECPGYEVNHFEVLS